MSSWPDSSPKRRAGEREQQSGGGLLRIPCVRRCELAFDGRAPVEAFLVNLNVLGTYVAFDGPVQVGELLSCSFTLPGNALALETRALVAWTNPSQQHPVHSLPAGFGLRFVRLAAEHQARITAAIEEHLRRGGGRLR